MNQVYKVQKIDDLVKVYSLLREKYVKNKMDISFDYNTKEYTLCVSDEIQKDQQNLKIPLDLGIKVIYGDSVTETTPILLKHKGNLVVKYIKDICSNYTTSIISGKEEGIVTDYQVWSEKGWNNIEKIIKHKTNKQLYKVCGQTGLVVVTEDHSLITSSNKLITPREHTGVYINEGKSEYAGKYTSTSVELLQSFPCNENNVHNNDNAFLLGFFAMNCFLEFKTNEVCVYIQIYTMEKYNYLNEYLKNSKMVYELDEYSNQSTYYTLDINLNDIGLKYENSLEIFNEAINYNIKSKVAFIKGCLITQEVPESYNDDFVNISKHNTIQYISDARYTNCLYYILKSIGVDCIIKNENTLILKKITDTSSYIIVYDEVYDEDVYDIQTAHGTFSAGIGEIVVKNTDSIFVEMTYNLDDFEENRKNTFKLSGIACEKLTNQVFNRHPIEMEFEKVFQPFILLTKKRYIGKKYEDLSDPFKLKEITTSGIAVTRRDFCQYTKDCYNQIIKIIVDADNTDTSNQTDSIDSSIIIFKGYIHNIDIYNVDIQRLIITAKLAKTYKTEPVHYILAQKLQARQQPVQIGDRIPYIFIEDITGNKLKKSHLGEDPTYAVEHNLKFNRGCYLTQLAKTMLGFFKVVMQHDLEKLNKLINFVNDKLVKYNSDKLKNSDFIID